MPGGAKVLYTKEVSLDCYCRQDASKLMQCFWEGFKRSYFLPRWDCFLLRGQAAAKRQAGQVVMRFRKYSAPGRGCEICTRCAFMTYPISREECRSSVVAGLPCASTTPGNDRRVNELELNVDVQTSNPCSRVEELELEMLGKP